MATVLCVRLGSIWFCKILARMRDSLWRKAWYKNEHYRRSACNKTMSTGDESIACLISAGRLRKKVGGGKDVAFVSEISCSFEHARVRRKRCAPLYAFSKPFSVNGETIAIDTSLRC